MSNTTDAPKVEYRRLGKSGLRVSVPILGAMSFGSDQWGKWVLNEDKVYLSRDIRYVLFVDLVHRLFHFSKLHGIVASTPGTLQTCTRMESQRGLLERPLNRYVFF
jgi:hypothetical protein